MTDESNANPDARPAQAERKNPNFLQVVLSVMAAAIGIQNQAVRERDFNAKSPLPFIVAGILFTVLFVSPLIAVVSWII
ncbi:MAG: DUF2970 domain-containing protein [Pseudomonadales bacterium]